MADKVCALLGRGQGPWVYTGNMEHPHIVASGVKSGLLQVETGDTPGAAGKLLNEFEFPVDRKSIPRGTYTRVTYLGDETKLIVHILSH